MDTTVTLAIVMVIGTVAGILGYYFERQKFNKELARGKIREEELARKAYETIILKEIGDRIGYSLDAAKIIEIISGSLGRLLPFSTVSYMILNEKGEKIIFSCMVAETISPAFVDDVRTKMLAAFSEMAQKPFNKSDLDESVRGVILDEELTDLVGSYFNLPIVISGKLAGIINVAAREKELYNQENTEVLYRIARQASEAVSKLNEVLENEKARLSQAVQALSDGLMMVDENYQLVLANRKLSQILGIVQSPTIFDIAGAMSGHLDLRTKVEEALAAETEILPQEIVVSDKVLQVVASRVLDKKTQKPIGVVVLFHDVTDAKALEQLRRDFSAMMVHELRSPLTSIRSTVELLKTDLAKLKEEDVAKYLSSVDITSQTMLELVNDLLDVAKLEAGKFDVICENGELDEAVSERVQNYNPLAASKGLKLTLEIEENLPQAYFDKIRIKQVLNNLLSNAIKYTQTGEIKVKVKREIIDNVLVGILVSISDTGIGINPDQIDLLFSKFGQLAAGRNKAGLKSSGLGLYIAHGIVEAWNGKIWAKSEGEGMGSTFYFTVPISMERQKTVGKQDAVFTGSKVAHA